MIGLPHDGPIVIENLEGMPEDERLATVAALQLQMPGRDLTHVLGGQLAGPATANRPDVPPWEYLAYASEHPEISLESLSAIRFPIVFFGREQSTIESIGERTYRNPKFGGLPTTIEDEVEIYARLRAAGMIRWSSERRAVEHLVPFAEFAPITTEWAAELPRR